MRDVGIDISHHVSKDLEEYRDEPFDYVITLCGAAKEECPVFSGATSIHWGFDDPAAATADTVVHSFRRVRDEIRQRLSLFILANKVWWT